MTETTQTAVCQTQDRPVAGRLKQSWAKLRRNRAALVGGILLLIYAAYFALRGAIDDPERRASLAAVYAILAFVTVPFLVFVVPRIYWSLHPDTIINTRGANEFDSRYTQVLMASLVGFTGLYVWIYTIGCRIEEIRQRRRQEVL